MKIFNVILIFISIVVNVLQGAIEEFCNSELFQPKCEISEVIVIQEAYFGRRTMGRCLLEEGKPSDSYLNDLQFMGCYGDVRDVMEAACSGRNSCDMIVSKIKVATNCHNWLKLNLEISYSCLKIIPESRHCTIQVTSERVHISNSLSSSSSCGSRNSPWKVETLTGQKLNISLVHIIGNIDNSAYFEVGLILQNRHECQEIGSIMDISHNRKSTKICSIGSGYKKNGLDYFVSNTNAMEIIFDKTNIKNRSGFVIGLEATGCSDLIPPADAWLKRTENEATIGCYSTRLRWKLKCDGQRWIGVIGNCSHGFSMEHNHESEKSAREQLAPENTLVLIVAIAMTGFVICFLVICIGVVFINRYYSLRKSKALKRMANLYMSRKEYNNETFSVYDNDKQFFSGNPRIVEPNGLHLKVADEESAHYFELDRSYKENGLVPSKV